MPTTLITGATSGIGMALAQQYAALGDTLLLVGRKPLSSLEDPLFSPENYCQADLSQPGAAQTLTRFIAARGITAIDRVIHNAGLGYFGSIDQQPAENIETLVAVNLRAPVALTHALIPHVKAARGAFVFISSVAAALPAADYAVYGATKAALDAFAYNLRIELGDEARVQLIHPGATRTDMHRKAGVPEGRLKTSTYPPAEKVAAQIVAIIASGRKQAAVGAANRLLVWAGTHLAWLIDPLMKGRAR